MNNKSNQQQEPLPPRPGWPENYTCCYGPDEVIALRRVLSSICKSQRRVDHLIDNIRDTAFRYRVYGKLRPTPRSKAQQILRGVEIDAARLFKRLEDLTRSDVRWSVHYALEGQINAEFTRLSAIKAGLPELRDGARAARLAYAKGRRRAPGKGRPSNVGAFGMACLCVAIWHQETGHWPGRRVKTETSRRGKAGQSYGPFLEFVEAVLHPTGLIRKSVDTVMRDALWFIKGGKEDGKRSMPPMETAVEAMVLLEHLKLDSATQSSLRQRLEALYGD